MGKDEYGVAYLEEDGSGFSDTEPFIVDCISLNSCKECVKDMIKDGYKKVTPFKYGKRLDYYSWDYINQHKLTLD